MKKKNKKGKAPAKAAKKKAPAKAIKRNIPAKGVPKKAPAKAIKKKAPVKGTKKKVAKPSNPSPRKSSSIDLRLIKEIADNLSRVADRVANSGDKELAKIIKTISSLILKGNDLYLAKNLQKAITDALEKKYSRFRRGHRDSLYGSLGSFGSFGSFGSSMH